MLFKLPNELLPKVMENAGQKDLKAHAESSRLLY
jgi:hypothetical protein